MEFLPILPPNCTKFIFFWVNSKKLSSDLESLHFPMFSQNAVNSKSGREMVMENHEWSWKSHGKKFVKFVGTKADRVPTNVLKIIPPRVSSLFLIIS